MFRFKALSVFIVLLLSVSASLADLNRAAEIAPKLAAAYTNRGVLRLQKGQEKLAEADFAQAAQLDPSLKPTLEKYLRKMREHNAKARQK